MGRLTFDGNFCDIAQCRELPCPHGGNCTQRKVWEKLKAYEDTGLGPEEVNNAVVGAELMAKGKLVSAFGVTAERLRELAEADKAGHLMVLPEGVKAMPDLTHKDCWSYIAPLIPTSSEMSQKIYVMVFQALKEADERRAGNG